MIVNPKRQISKKRLQMILEELKTYDSPNFKLEQYSMNSACASDIIFIAGVENNDIKGKTVIDLGCGTGVLTIAACLLGAQKVFAVDIDKNSIEIGQMNAEKLGLNDKIEWINSDIEDFNQKGDTVIQNPPFGIRTKRHMDLIFLKKAISLANTCYSLHKAGEKNRIFLSNYIKNLNATVLNIIPLQIHIPKSYYFHLKNKIKIDVDLYHIIIKKAL